MDQELYEALPGMLEDNFKLLPVNGKRPLLSDWTNRASGDSRQIEQWLEWSGTTGLAVATGASRLLVVDVDGPEGQDALDQWQQDHGKLPATRTQRTGRDGGRHYLFRTDVPASTRGHFLPKVDVRGVGGYVVAAPSKHPSGRRYQADQTPIAPAPRSLIDEVGVWQGLAIPPEVGEALVAPRGRRSEHLFVIYRWAVDSGLPENEMYRLILGSLVGSKARDTLDADGWLRTDFERSTKKRRDDYDPTAEIHRAIKARERSGVRLNGSDRKILGAIDRLALDRKSMRVTRSLSDLAVDAGMSTKTVMRRAPRLDNYGLLRQVEKGGGLRATVWQLAVPPASPHSSVDHEAEQGAVSSVPPSPQPERVYVGVTDQVTDPSLDEHRYQVLGGSYGYLCELSAGEQSVEDLMKSMAVDRRCVLRHLEKLGRLGVSEEMDDGRFALAADYRDRLHELAVAVGVEGRKARDQVRNEQNRALRRAELERGRIYRQDALDVADRLMRPGIRRSTFLKLAHVKGAVVEDGRMIDCASGEVLAREVDTEWRKWHETGPICQAVAARHLGNLLAGLKGLESTATEQH